MRKTVLIMIIGLLLCPAIVLAKSPAVTATYHKVSDGYQLDFLVQAGNYQVSGWQISRIDCSDPIAPEGWNALVFTRYTQWYTNIADRCIQPSGYLTGCSVSFSELPVQLDYVVLQAGPTATYYGTLTPQAVPEPSSILALLTGVCGLGGFALKRRHA